MRQKKKTMIKNILCKAGIHQWRNTNPYNPYARVCNNLNCEQLDEIHENCTSDNTWNFNTTNGYWKTTRKSKLKTII